ncbi:hypothetical protein [Peribacillus sp. SCS-155]|uniref:hypothetical protein n=1 Tax=Peribacillus sedimenti TaxID=3115297 RepID=UPI003906813D
MAKDFEGLIQELTHEKDQLILEMDGIKNKFLEEVASFCSVWFDKEAIALIARKSDLAKNLGIEKLKLLKAEVRSLIKNAKNVVAEHMDKEEFWWHQQDKGDFSSYSYEHRPVERIHEAMRYICGKLGVIFSHDGLVKLKQTGFIKDYDVWTKSGRPYYPYGSPLPDDIVDIYREYNSLTMKVQEIDRRMVQVKKEKEEISVVDLWESL